MQVEGEELVRNLQAPALAAALVTRAFFADFVRRDSGAIVQIISPGRWPVLAMYSGRRGAGGGDVCGWTAWACGWMSYAALCV